MFSNKALRRTAFTICPNWSGGVYGKQQRHRVSLAIYTGTLTTKVSGTSTLAGSRPGALVAATWASLMYHGLEGYTRKCRKVIEATRALAEGIRSIPGLRLMCEPDASVVSFTSDVFDIYRLTEPLLHECGWEASVLQFPPGIHVALTLAHTTPGVVDRFIADIRACTAPLLATQHEKARFVLSLFAVSSVVS